MAWLEPVSLKGPYARLEPLSQDQCDGLTEAVKDGELWKLWYTSIPRAEDMLTEIDRRLGLQASGAMMPWTVYDADGKISPAGVTSAWERIKAEEKAERAARRGSEAAHKSLLASVKAGLPALTRALELQRKASTVGFDWNDPRAVLQKIREEADEIEAALDRNDIEELADETGDLLFAVVNLARHAKTDPEMALRRTNAKFERRFAYIEGALAAQGRSLSEATLDEMDELWNEAKAKEKSDV